MLQMLSPSPKTIPPPRPPSPTSRGHPASQGALPSRHICIPWCPLPLNYHSLSVTGPGPHGCSVVAGRRHCCSTPQPLNHSRRPDWPGAASAPAQPGLPGALSDNQRLRTSLQGRLYHCLKSCFSGSQVGMAARYPWILKVLEDVLMTFPYRPLEYLA